MYPASCSALNHFNLLYVLSYVRVPDRLVALYSTIGLTRALYACSLDLAEQVQRLPRREFRVLFALVVVAFTWWFQRKSGERLIPKYLVVSTDSRALPWSFYWNLKGVCLRVTRITLHWLGLNSIHQSDSHFSKLWRSSCNCRESLSDFIVR